MHALAMEVIRSLSLIRQIILFVVGAPLVCRVADRWYVAGLVSWGVSKYRSLVARPVKFKVNFCRFIIRLWPKHSRCLHEYKNFSLNVSMIQQFYCRCQLLPSVDSKPNTIALKSLLVFLSTMLNIL